MDEFIESVLRPPGGSGFKEMERSTFPHYRNEEKYATLMKSFPHLFSQIPVSAGIGFPSSSSESDPEDPCETH